LGKKKKDRSRSLRAGGPISAVSNLQGIRTRKNRRVLQLKKKKGWAGRKDRGQLTSQKKDKSEKTRARDIALLGHGRTVPEL